MLVLGALLVCSCLYYLGALAALIRSRRAPSVELLRSDSSLGVSLLKPAVGAGSEFTDLLRSHAAQDYPEFEILVGAGVGDSDARAAVRQLQNEYPKLEIQLIDCPEATPGCNGKVEVLERLAEHARNPIWVVSDADTRVPSHYLRTLCSELSKPNTGLVTCLYAAEPGIRLASQLQAIRLNTEFPAQVLLARWLQGLRFGLGSTLALRAETLRRIGGFGSLRGLIGDDYHLGAKVTANGLGVDVSTVSVSTRLPRGDGWRQTWQRELRWSRTIRMQRPAGHAALPVTFGTLWACTALVVRPDALWPLATVCLGLRLATGAFTAVRVGCADAIRILWLVPVSDLWACLVWVYSFFGNSVSWAGRQLRIGAGGRILE